MDKIVCELCPFKCSLADEEIGKCKVRANKAGMMQLLTYGQVTTMVEGPIEQKPIYHYHPGMKVLSIGSSGCNMFCKYCQNFEISQTGDAPSTIVEPQEVVARAKELGCKGIAFTYSEPLVWYEYVMNVAVCAKKSGLKTVLKTNAFLDEDRFSEMMNWIDAINIDIKGNALLYKEVVGIDLPESYDDWSIMRNLRTAWRKCHVEISTIVIPQYYRNATDNHALFKAIRKHSHKDVPIHLLKFIPDFQMRETPAPTEDELALVEQAASFNFRYVYIDYAGIPAITYCKCGQSLVERKGIELKKVSLIKGNRCPNCGDLHSFEV